MAKKAYRLSVLVVEAASGVAALACKDSDTCAVGRGQGSDSAVAHAVKALEQGYTQSKAEAKELLNSAEDVWGEELKRAAAMGGTDVRRRRGRGR
jgi:hypothetical protein